MRNPRTLRGSAYLYVVTCVGVMGTVLVALVPLVTQARTTQTRRLEKVKSDLAEESLIQQVMAEVVIAPVVANSTRTLTINGTAVTVTITDGSATVPNSLKLSGTGVVAGRTHTFTRYIGKGVSATPYSFAIYTQSDMAHPGKLITGANGANGDVFCDGKINLTSVSGTTINGDISSKKDIKLSGQTVTGNMVENASSVPMPAISGLNYYTNASFRIIGPSTSGAGATFGGMTNGHYEIYHITGNVNFQGPITGKGIVFVTGNVVVTGNMSYSNASSQVAVIVQGDVTINAGVSQIVGILYVGGTLNVSSPDVNMTRGSIIAKTIASGPIIRATRDNFMQTSSTEGTKLCLPGYWP